MDEEKIFSGISAPITVYTGDNNQSFYFEVEDKKGNISEYKISFVECDLFADLPIYSILIGRTQKVTENSGVAETIICIVKHLLDKDKVFCYTCDTEDGKQFARNRLFNSWFKIQKDASLNYDLTKIESSGDIVGGMLISKHNPLLSSYKEAAIDFVATINQVKQDKITIF